MHPQSDQEEIERIQRENEKVLFHETRQNNYLQETLQTDEKDPVLYQIVYFNVEIYLNDLSRCKP